MTNIAHLFLGNREWFFLKILLLLLPTYLKCVFQSGLHTSLPQLRNGNEGSVQFHFEKVYFLYIRACNDIR